MSATWRIENDIFTHEDLPSMIPMLVQPYPPGIWWIENDIFKHTALPDMIPMLVHPYPPGVWYLDNDIFKQDALPDMVKTGAFSDCAFLNQVSIPRSVKLIGEAAFADTALTRVRIASDCTYSATSFPAGCDVDSYEAE